MEPPTFIRPGRLEPTACFLGFSGRIRSPQGRGSGDRDAVEDESVAPRQRALARAGSEPDLCYPLAVEFHLGPLGGGCFPTLVRERLAADENSDRRNA